MPARTASSASRKVRGTVSTEDFEVYELDEEDPVLAPTSPAGPSGSLTPRGRAFAIALGVAALLVAIGVAAWYAWGAPTIRGKEVGFSVTSSESITITFDVAKPQDVTVLCVLDALNESYAQVGTKNVLIGPAEVFEQRFSTDIRTTETAVTAVVTSCSAVDPNSTDLPASD
ncbi:hypothetical protein Jden_1892 [Jonesia denitrificans DSM 20603]|uniref:DUF4307 domain-containing protein n=1 Tax=Jonesia denitrificans (strain ATCC 14870 / DSM 20603 / BCRC 15368 / CIP 55.134 / JCM 11481 / NBRC 15587 / NCTC 10816 / Prevot 55134) TaxID=471856 RepID=C7QZX7_JONDD|nr:hypothetical protein Jden_1892 [Jonesia denitrificans DSM 20603]ASE09235.1 DUF4307 domain-containing protein [Jonesia denitrificans]SQH21932.1 Uncharacterised protein [Jonesia denitrificans]